MTALSIVSLLIACFAFFVAFGLFDRCYYAIVCRKSVTVVAQKNPMPSSRYGISADDFLSFDWLSCLLIAGAGALKNIIPMSNEFHSNPPTNIVDVFVSKRDRTVG